MKPTREQAIQWVNESEYIGKGSAMDDAMAMFDWLTEQEQDKPIHGKPIEDDNRLTSIHQICRKCVYLPNNSVKSPCMGCGVFSDYGDQIGFPSKFKPIKHETITIPEQSVDADRAIRSHVRILDPKGLLQQKSMSLYAEQGRKVTVTEKSIINGYSHDEEKAKKYLKVGEIYTVKSMDVQDWSSSIILEEIPNQTFNTVNFVDVKPDHLPDVGETIKPTVKPVTCDYCGVECNPSYHCDWGIMCGKHCFTNPHETGRTAEEVLQEFICSTDDRGDEWYDKDKALDAMHIYADQETKILHELMVSGEKRGIDKANQEWKEKIAKHIGTLIKPMSDPEFWSSRRIIDELEQLLKEEPK